MMGGRTQDGHDMNNIAGLGRMGYDVDSAVKCPRWMDGLIHDS